MAFKMSDITIDNKTDTNVEVNNDNYNLTNVIDDVHKNSETGVKYDVDKGSKSIKQEGGFLETLKNIGIGLLKALSTLLLGTLSMAGSMLLGKGMGLPMGSMGVGSMFGNPLGSLLGSLMSPNFWGGYPNNRENSMLNSGMNYDREMVNLRELEPVLKNLGEKFKELLDENRMLKGKMTNIHDISNIRANNSIMLTPNYSKYNFSNMLNDYKNVLYAGSPMMNTNTINNHFTRDTSMNTDSFKIFNF